MFRGFNLELDDNGILNSLKLYDYFPMGLAVHKIFKKEVRQKLDSFLNSDGSLDASKMKANWFPQINSQIFISHSHKDEDTAISLAGWFHEKFKLTAFVDSCIWGYSDELLQMIDKKYCYDRGSKTYDYQKRNYSTSHVHMMLSTSLSKMIDRSECLIFLNTPNSITPRDVIRDKNETLSPWIYSEIAMTQLIRKKSINEHRTMRKTNAMFSEQIRIMHDLDLSHLTNINDRVLVKWLLKSLKHPQPENHLDILYELCPLK